MAVAVQPQWDIGASAFALAGKSLGLARAATVDNVQPAAVLAAEALGSQMIVDSHLIGKAVDALGGDKSYRMDSIKLYLGLSSGGVASQIRQSTPAIKTFLLVTWLKLHMVSGEIGDVLYDLLVRSNTIDTVPVSSKQLADLVRSLESHALLLEQTESLASNFLKPLLEKIVSAEGTLHRAYLAQVAANQASQALLACFDAIKNEELQCLEISGANGLTYLICLLCWFCPNSIHATTREGLVLTDGTSEAAKIHICLDPAQESWHIRHFFKIQGPGILVDTVDKDPTYLWDACPSFVPMEMTYFALRAYGPLWFADADHSEVVDGIGILAYGLIYAALDHGCVRRRGILIDPLQTVPFHEICSQERVAALRQGLSILGYPLSRQSLEFGPVISAFFPRDAEELLPSNRHTLMQNLDLECMGGLALTAANEDFRSVQFIELSMKIAETVLVRATQTQPADVPFRDVFFEDVSLGSNMSVLCPLLSKDPHNALSAPGYMHAALQSLTSNPREPERDMIPYLARSHAGQVAYLSGLLNYPRSTSDAFEIIVQPGRIKWKDNFQDVLLDCRMVTWSNSRDLHTTYQFFDGSETKTLLPSLRNTSHRKDGFTVSVGPDGPRLQYVEAATGEKTAMFSFSLVNWALAKRVQRSQEAFKGQIMECVKLGVSALRLKQPGTGQVGLDGDFESRMSVATYGDDKWANLLRFGSVDAVNAYQLIQGHASIPDCAAEARRLYGTNFIIMANA